MPKAGQGVVLNAFAGVGNAKEVHALEAEIDRLKQEIDTLQNQGQEVPTEQLNKLREQLLSQGGVIDVPLEQIARNPDQPRQTFTDDSIAGMALSLQSEGQQEPIILIERPEASYFIFDGERRWRGAQRLQWPTLKAVVIPEPEALHRRVLLANLHREELNALDIAEAVVEEIHRTHAIEHKDIPKLLRAAVRRLERQKRSAEVTAIVLAAPEERDSVLQDLNLADDEQAIFATLLGLQLNPSSTNANIFPMLGLVDDLKDAIRAKGLGGPHALVLNKLTPSKLQVTPAVAKKRRAKLLKQVFEQKLSVARVRALVNEELRSKEETPATPPQKAQVESVTHTLKELYTDFDELGIEELKSLQQVIDPLAEQISARISALEQK